MVRLPTAVPVPQLSEVKVPDPDTPPQVPLVPPSSGGTSKKVGTLLPPTKRAQLPLSVYTPLLGPMPSRGGENAPNVPPISTTSASATGAAAAPAGARAAAPTASRAAAI